MVEGADLGFGGDQGERQGSHVLRISVRTLAIRLMIRALTLVLSTAPPKEGEGGVEPHPTGSERIARLAYSPGYWGIVGRGRRDGGTKFHGAVSEQGAGRHRGRVGEDVLRARKRSSDRMAMALVRRMETAVACVSGLCAWESGLDLWGREGG